MMTTLISILVISIILILVLVGLVVREENSVDGHAQSKKGNSDFAACAA